MLFLSAPMGVGGHCMASYSRTVWRNGYILTWLRGQCVETKLNPREKLYGRTKLFIFGAFGTTHNSIWVKGQSWDKHNIQQDLHVRLNQGRISNSLSQNIAEPNPTLRTSLIILWAFMTYLYGQNSRILHRNVFFCQVCMSTPNDITNLPKTQKHIFGLILKASKFNIWTRFWLEWQLTLPFIQKFLLVHNLVFFGSWI